MHNNSITSVAILQEKSDILTDFSPTGRLNPWKEKKSKSNFVSLLYDVLAQEEADTFQHDYYFKRSLNMESCASITEWLENPETGKKKLKNGHFCRLRSCPMCSWRRSLKIYGQCSKVMKHLQNTQNSARYIFATFTVKNVKAEDLETTLDKMIKAFPQMMRDTKFKKSLLGAYRGIEITHNAKDNTYHPHIHAIFMVKSSYFKVGNYLTQAEFTELWERKMKLDYKPVVDVRKIKENTAKAVAEVAKYTVKDDDIVKPEDVDLAKEILKTLDSVLKYKRLVAFYGEMKKAHKELNLDDTIDGDLNITNNDDDEKVDNLLEVTYAFNVGCRDYFKVNEKDYIKSFDFDKKRHQKEIGADRKKKLLDEKKRIDEKKKLKAERENAKLDAENPFLNPN